MVTVRAARDADSPAVLALVTGVLTEYSMCPDPTGEDADLSSLEASYAARGGWFEVLEEDGQILGTVAVLPLSERDCQLRKMYFHPSLRGRGLGRALLDRTLRRAQAAGFGTMRLETASELVEAIGLYRSAGFRELAERPGVSRCDRAFSVVLSEYTGRPDLSTLEES